MKQPTSDWKLRFKAWLGKTWHAFWTRFKYLWHRFQLTRWIIVVLMSLFLVISIYLTFVAKTANVKDLERRLEQPTMIYDSKGKSAGSLYSQKGTYVKLSKISANVPDAVLSTEDRRFYQEHGFSVRGLGRAALLLVKNKLLGRDYISGGGSTLTQQLVKNAFLSQEQTFSRKAKEIFIAIEVENQYSKKQILTMYLNNAYFGNGVWGVQDTYKYPYYFDAVISEAVNTYHLSEKDIMNNGYKIYTTLNQNQQKAMQDTYDDDSNFPDSSTGSTMVQSASIAMDPKTGGVTAVVGGRGKHVFRGYNRATQMRRQPGSTIKPIVVYTPALEKGYFYDSTLQDKKTSYGSNHYTPKNYDNTYSGSVPMYKALYESLNAPAVWLLNKIGINAGYQMAEKFGLPVEKSDKNLALALGGMSNGVSPQQMARAYSVFANGGKLPAAHYIVKIEDANGKVIKRYRAKPAKQIISKKISNEMTSMLLGVFNHGTGVSAKPDGYKLAGKTGTTDSGIGDGDRDKWIVGYTPDIVVATWEGYDSTTESQQLADVTSKNISVLYKAEMSAILPETAGTQFTVKDAQAKATAKQNKTSSSWWSNFTNNLNDSGSTLKQKASDWWSSLQSMFQ